jgi:hypothetical protein
MTGTRASRTSRYPRRKSNTKPIIKTLRRDLSAPQSVFARAGYPRRIRNTKTNHHESPLLLLLPPDPPRRSPPTTNHESAHMLPAAFASVTSSVPFVALATA